MLSSSSPFRGRIKVEVKEEGGMKFNPAKILNVRVKPFLIAVSVFSLLVSFSSFAGEHMRIGVQDSIQQEILGQIAGAYLEDKGFKVKYKTGLSQYSLREALIQGRVDLALEDPAVVWFFELLKPDVLLPRKIYQKVKALDKKKGLYWLTRTRLERQYVLVMKAERARKLHVRAISDLKEHLEKTPKNIKIAMSSQFFFRPDCYLALKQVYGISFPRQNIKKVPSGMGFGLLAGGQVDIVAVFSTEPLIRKKNLIKLEDKNRALVSYPVGIAVREKIVEKSPQLAEWIKKLGEIIPSASEIAGLNLEVYNGASPHEVARRYLAKRIN